MTAPRGCKGDQNDAGQAWLSAEGVERDPSGILKGERVRRDRDSDTGLAEEKVEARLETGSPVGVLKCPLAFFLRPVAESFAGRCPRSFCSCLPRERGGKR